MPLTFDLSSSGSQVGDFLKDVELVGGQVGVESGTGVLLVDFWVMSLEWGKGLELSLHSIVVSVSGKSKRVVVGNKGEKSSGGGDSTLLESLLPS